VTEDDEGIPAAARLLRDFVNTREPQLDAESLDTAHHLRDWFAARHLLPPGARLGVDDLPRALALREGLRNVLLEHAGLSSDPAALEAYTVTLAGLPVRLDYGNGSHRLVPALDGPAAYAFTQLLDAVRQCERDHTWHRLKVCARDSCRWAFYDASRNQTRRWCSMAGCGNHIKMKRAYANRRTRQQQAIGISASEAVIKRRGRA
jgi:predicted RNA-binding Zn ribbon-like protein